ncbi:hypothetical protein F5144DRAFT_171512 [Chaetomium tenue]|uniref:Uncharacterized protein n=1 Tax=Chaetomium tenue TaxID=1854479 RepID=A0ACB7PEY2_9PEZI|nr:hypothetical protein F5144DRAFT_171512 [Chaetomium globosum]
MFSLRSSAPARRAACAVLQPNVFVLTSQLSVSSHLGQPQQQQVQQQRRQYAMRAPSVSKRKRFIPLALVDSPDLPDLPNFPFKDVPIPPIDLWRSFKDKRGLGEMAPETCLHAFKQYCLVAPNDPMSTAPALVLERDFNIDLYTLYYTSLPLINSLDQSLAKIGYRMLIMASNLGYAPSTLTVVGMVAQTGRQPKNAKSTAWRAFDTNFKRLVRTGNSPDIFTLQGLLAKLQGDADNYVMSCLDKAIQAARSIPRSIADQPAPKNQDTPAGRKPRWTYEAFCHLGRGRILLKLNRTREALASFKIAALELDHPDGYAELAKLLPPDAPERETYLIMAAQAGNFEACRLLALLMADRAADPALPRGERAVASKMAHEWAAMEPDAELREQVGLQVTEKLSAASLG